MKAILLKIFSQSPLAIGRKKTGVVNEAEDYIPGSVIRGAIASQLLQQTGYQHQDLSKNGGDFQKLFLDNSCAIFNNAYPSPLHQMSSILPATAVSSKTNPGFRQKGNGVFDTLIDRFCAESFQHPYDPNCPTDGERIEPFSGFYTINENQYQTHSVAKSLLTRTGINRRRNVVEEDILYSLEVLNETTAKEATCYQGKIIITEDTLAESLANYINRNQNAFRLGGAISRGLGKVTIEAKVQELENNLSFRLQQFNHTLQKRWQRWQTLFNSRNADTIQRTYFTINLQADTILTKNWQATTLLTPELLQQATETEDNTLILHTAYTSYDYRSGWNSAWGLMKDMVLVTNIGSVYLFSTTQPQLCQNSLSQLEQRGIGERTEEGFGQVEICHPFHFIFREKAV